MSIVEKILFLCKSHNMAGTEFAKHLSLKKSPLTDWKNKKSNPTLDQITIICDIFSISADYLFSNSNQSNYSNMSADERMIVNQYRELDENNKDTILKFINEIWATQQHSNSRRTITSKDVLTSKLSNSSKTG